MQFTLNLHYERGPDRSYPLAVILRSHPLSVKSPQLRFVVRGTRGTYTKHGLDAQEEHLKLISSPRAILREEFGREPEYLNGKVENILADNETITKTMYVIRTCMCGLLLILFSADGQLQMLAVTSSFSKTSDQQFGQELCLV